MQGKPGVSSEVLKAWKLPNELMSLWKHQGHIIRPNHWIAEMGVSQETDAWALQALGEYCMACTQPIAGDGVMANMSNAGFSPLEREQETVNGRQEVQAPFPSTLEYYNVKTTQVRPCLESSHTRGLTYLKIKKTLCLDFDICQFWSWSRTC